MKTEDRRSTTDWKFAWKYSNDMAFYETIIYLKTALLNIRATVFGVKVVLRIHRTEADCVVHKSKEQKCGT